MERKKYYTSNKRLNDKERKSIQRHEMIYISMHVYIPVNDLHIFLFID